MIPIPVSLARQQQQTDELLDALRDYRMSNAGTPEHGRDRRWALRLLAEERARKDARHAELMAACHRQPRRTAA